MKPSNNRSEASCVSPEEEEEDEEEEEEDEEAGEGENEERAVDFRSLGKM